MYMFRVLLLAPLLLVSLSRAAVLVDFQVAQPPPLPKNAKQCTVKILERTFGFSFGSPEIVQFAPPTNCGPAGSWAGVSLNFTVTSNGTQFDRLGIFTFQNVEIWRTSTPEPTPDGIIWTYTKDVTRYIPLFAKPGTFILQLDNLLSTQPLLNGQYATTLSATFFASSRSHPPAKQANTIIPISTLSSITGNDASVPPGFSLNITVPRNAVELYAELQASGNGQEEFWYFNVANDFLADFPAGTLGQGPFREVRLQIDGQVAGVAFPYATIFTGGILSTAWRPITSYGALDLPTYFLDLTPFIPILADGNPHNFTLDVVSAESDHTINQNWFVSGLLQVVLDSSSKPTTGQITSYNAKPFADSTVTGSVGDNGDVNITVKATRQIHVESTILSGSGKLTHVVWSQNLEYSNFQTYTDNTLVQTLVQAASGNVMSTHNGIPAVTDLFSYPLDINITGLVPDFSFFKAFFDHSYNRVLLPSAFILGSTIRERQQAGEYSVSCGFFTIAKTGNSGNGTSNNTFSYVDLAGNTYDREVNAALNNITFDHQGGNLAPSSPPRYPTFPQKAVNVGEGRLPGGRVIRANPSH